MGPSNRKTPPQREATITFEAKNWRKSLWGGGGAIRNGKGSPWYSKRGDHFLLKTTRKRKEKGG